MRRYFYYWAANIETGKIINFYSSELFEINEHIFKNKATYKIIDWAFA